MKNPLKTAALLAGLLLSEAEDAEQNTNNHNDCNPNRCGTAIFDEYGIPFLNRHIVYNS